MARSVRLLAPDGYEGPTVGYSTYWHLLVDLDLTTPVKVDYVVEALNKYYDMTCVLVCVSSVCSVPPLYIAETNVVMPALGKRLNVHLIYDKVVDYDRITEICETLAWLNVANPQYVWIRQWRGDVTLRVSPHIGGDTAPQPVVFKSFYFYQIPLNIITYLQTLSAFNPVAKKWIARLFASQKHLCYQCVNKNPEKCKKDIKTVLLEFVKQF